jgi:uroporphyrinogen-III synthase
MKLIITRPPADAEPLAEKLRVRGHTPVLVPLLEIVPRQHLTLQHRRYQALCLTSANGIIQHAPYLSVPVLAVGPQSAAAATQAGYRHVTHHGGDVEGLVEHIAHHLKPEDGPLLYLSGATTSGDLEGKLQRWGFTVDRLVTYDAIPTVPVISPAMLQSADGVLLYSPRSAMLWVAATERAGAEAHILRLKHYCLSVNVAKVLPQSWPTRIATAPTESALLATLEPQSEQE